MTKKISEIGMCWYFIRQIFPIMLIFWVYGAWDSTHTSLTLGWGTWICFLLSIIWLDISSENLILEMMSI